MYDHGMIAPVLALAIWTLVMLIWLYALRIPAMQKAKIDAQEAEKNPSAFAGAIPRAAQRPAENYNHLHEQPTVFYAVCLAAQIVGVTDATTIGIAWTYVALRVIHSLIQATANIIMLRFLVFAIASIALIALTARVAMAVFS